MLAAKNASVSTDTTVPTASITSPASGASVSGAVTVSAQATDNVSVSKVELYKDGALYATTLTAPYTFFWDTTLTADGAHTLSAKAYDSSGNVTTSTTLSVIVANGASAGTGGGGGTTTPTPDTISPTVTIVSPANGTKIKGNGSISISVNATDNIGVASLGIFADGQQLTSCTKATTCSASWTGKSITSGTHTISAKATDAAGNMSSASVTVSK